LVFSEIRGAEKKKKNQKKFWRMKKGFYLCRPENKGSAGDRGLEENRRLLLRKKEEFFVMMKA